RQALGEKPAEGVAAVLRQPAIAREQSAVEVGYVEGSHREGTLRRPARGREWPGTGHQRARIRSGPRGSGSVPVSRTSSEDSRRPLAAAEVRRGYRSEAPSVEHGSRITAVSKSSPARPERATGDVAVLVIRA